MWLEPGELMPAPLAQIPLGAFDANFRLKISICQPFVVLRPVYSRQLVEKHVKRFDPAVPRDDEVPPGVSRHFTRASRYPWNHPCIAIFLRSGSHLISKVRMSRLDRARDAIDLVAATNGTLARIVEHAIFGPELVDGRSPARGIVFTKDVAKISDQ